VKPSCPQLAGTETIRVHPARVHRDRLVTLFTLREARRLDERKRQYDWSRSRVK
jgi:hypothetical protein